MKLSVGFLAILLILVAVFQNCGGQEFQVLNIGSEAVNLKPVDPEKDLEIYPLTVPLDSLPPLPSLDQHTYNNLIPRVANADYATYYENLNSFTHSVIPPFRSSFDHRILIGNCNLDPTPNRSGLAGTESSPQLCVWVNAPEKFGAGYENVSLDGRLPNPFKIQAQQLHAAGGGSTSWTLHSTFCEPYGRSDFPMIAVNQANANPKACGANQDCYELSIVTPVESPDGANRTKWQLWSVPATIMVSNPKTMNAVVSNVQLGTPAPITPFEIRENNANFLLEPIFTGDGKLLIANVNDRIQYSFSANACQPNGFSPFRHVSDMYTDNRLGNYGVAKFPMRTQLNEVIAPNTPIAGSYPWINRTGAVLFFMDGSRTLHHIQFGVGNIEPKWPISCAPGVANCYDPINEESDDPNNPAFPIMYAAESVEDSFPRIWMRFFGLWTHGKLVSVDNRLNNLDFGMRPGLGSVVNRQIAMYKNAANQPVNVVVGQSQVVKISSIENVLNNYKGLLPKTPRDVVWLMSASTGMAEVAFDDYLETEALIVSNMTSPGLKYRNPGDVNAQPFLPRNHESFDGWDCTYVTICKGPLEGELRVTNDATSVSPAVGALIGNNGVVRWNVPSYGVLRGGARIEPIAAGGVEGKGVFFDGVNDRIEYLIPTQPTNILTKSHFVSVWLDSRDLSVRRRVLEYPDGSFIDISTANQILLGKGAAVLFDIPVPNELAIQMGRWVHFGLQVQPAANTTTLIFYLNGFELRGTVAPGNHFALSPGNLILGDDANGFRGWVDEFKLFVREMDYEVACNHAHGTIVEVRAGDSFYSRALAYPDVSHQKAAFYSGRPATSKFSCESSVVARQAALSVKCIQNFRRSTSADCMRDNLIFPEGPLVHNQPRPASTANAFCLTCHTNDSPSTHMHATMSLSLMAGVTQSQDFRRQPMQTLRIQTGRTPANLMGTGIPLTAQTQPFLLDPYFHPAPPTTTTTTTTITTTTVLVTTTTQPVTTTTLVGGTTTTLPNGTTTTTLASVTTTTILENEGGGGEGTQDYVVRRNKDRPIFPSCSRSAFQNGAKDSKSKNAALPLLLMFVPLALSIYLRRKK